MHAVGLVLASDSAVLAEDLDAPADGEPWTWQHAFAGDASAIATKVGRAVFLEDGVAVDDAGDLLDLAVLFTSGLRDEEIVGRLRALARGEHARTVADALASLQREPASRVLFSPLREDEIVLGLPWRRSEFLHGDPVQLPLEGSSAAFWSGAGRVALVSSHGQVLPWPPLPGARPFEARLSCAEEFQIGKASSIVAGPNVLVSAAENRLRVIRGGPPADTREWARLAATTTALEIPQQGTLTCVVLAPDGEQFYAVDAGTGAYFGRTDGSRMESASGGESPGGHPMSAACAPRRGLFASLGRAVELFDTWERRRVACTPSGRDIEAKIYAAFDPSERYIALVFRDVLAVIDIESLRAWPLFPIRRGELTSYHAPVPVAFSRSGEFLAVGGEQVTIHRWSQIVPMIERMPSLPWTPLQND